MKHDLLSVLQSKSALFSKGQRRIAAYLTNHYDKAAFMTANRLGNAAGVSESTVVRFAGTLGYEGYPQLQSAMQELVRNRMTALQRIEFAEDRLANQDVYRRVLSADIEKIRATMEQETGENFRNVVDTILAADKIYILGVRSSAALASFLGFYFNLLFDSVRLVHTTSVSEMFEQILRVREGDVVIGISFPRYSRRTIKALSYAKDQGARVVAITDTTLSPLYAMADLSLLAKSDMVSFADSLVAPLSVINALICAIGMRKKLEISDIFARLEEVWSEYQVYEKYDEES